MVALKDPPLLGRQIEIVSPFVQRRDAPEQVVVEIDLAVMPGEDRRDLALDLFQRIAGIGARQVEEHGSDLPQFGAARLQHLDHVLEARFGRIGGYVGDLPPVRFERGVECGLEMLRPDLAKRRRFEGGGPIG